MTVTPTIVVAAGFGALAAMLVMALMAKRMEARVADLQAAIDAVVAQLSRAKDEIVAEIGQLQAAVDAGQPIDLAPLLEAAQSLDDVVPDAVESVPDSGEAASSE